jgi:hypothetical protein
MRTHRLAAIIASLFLLSTPAIATAIPADANYPRAVAPTTGPTPSDFAQAKSSAPVGDTKFDLGTKAAAPSVGDTKYDSPGASRAPEFEPPTTIQVVRPERTIVRDVNDELPVILAGLALLVALGGTGFALVRTRRIAVSR